MMYLLIFVLGIVFVAVVFPLLNILVEYIDAIKTVKISSMSVEIAENNSIIEELSSKAEPSSVSAIGFQCQEPVDDCEEEEEDKEHGIIKGRVGF